MWSNKFSCSSLAIRTHLIVVVVNGYLGSWEAGNLKHNTQNSRKKTMSELSFCFCRDVRLELEQNFQKKTVPRGDSRC